MAYTTRSATSHTARRSSWIARGCCAGARRATATWFATAARSSAYWISSPRVRHRLTHHQGRRTRFTCYARYCWSAARESLRPGDGPHGSSPPGLGERAGQVGEGAGEKSDVGQLEKDRRVMSILYGVVRRTSESAKEPANRKGTPDASDGHREGNQGVGSGDQAR